MESKAISQTERPDDTARDVKVALRNVTRRFGDVAANDAIDLDIYNGEFLTLLGPSGCGKTTLMRIIAGLERCDEGTIGIDGKDMTNVHPRHRHIGMVFQQYSLFPHMNVAENVAYGLKVLGWDRARIATRVQEMLTLVRLPDVGQRPISALSGGQQQRISLARALASSPSLLMLDEPLGALDLKLRRQLQTELKRIHRATGVTFLLVTHDQEEALHMSDRIAVMRAGRIEQIDTPRGIYDHPATSYVADFVGDVTLLDAVGRDGHAYLPASTMPMRVGTGQLPAGPLRLVVRPEHVRLTEADGSVPQAGTISEWQIEGGTVLAEITLDCGAAIKARVMAPDAGNLGYGKRVGISIEGVTAWVPAR